MPSSQGVQPEHVLSHLGKVLESAEFARSGRVATFLRFLVVTTVAEDYEELKERRIGVTIFGRPPDWDPKLDNIVRGEARRVRDKLASYYTGPGRRDSIRISIPKGAYVAAFTAMPGRDTEPAELGTTTSASGSTQQLQIQPYNRRWRLASVALLVTVAVSIVLWRLELLSGRQDAFQITPFANESGQEFSPAISPDGRRIAYVWDGNHANFDIYVKDLDQAQALRVTDSALPDLNPSWSPDGKRIAFLRVQSDQASLIVRDLARGQEQVVAETRSPISGWVADSNPLAGCYGPSWSGDGQRLIFMDRLTHGSSFGLFSVALNTHERNQLTSPNEETIDACPRLSPDGRAIAFVRYSSHGIGEINVIDADGSRLHQVTSDRRGIRGISWSANGQQIIFSAFRDGQFQLREIGASGGPSRLITTNADSAVDIANARSGAFLAFTSVEENWNIWRIPLGGDETVRPEELLSSTGRNLGALYSPDGSQIAFVSDRSGSPEIWLAAADGSRLRRLTNFNGPWLGGISWSPDGQHLAFDSRPSGHSSIFTISASGGHPAPLEENHAEERNPAFSEDGKALYFNSNRDGRLRIWRHRLDGKSDPTVVATDISTFIVKPKNGKLYFLGPDHHLWVSDLDGRSAAELPDGPAPDPVNDWAVTPLGIYFAGLQQDRPTLFLYRFSDHSTRVIAHPDKPQSPSVSSLAVSPDGRSLIYSQVDRITSEIRLRRPGI